MKALKSSGPKNLLLAHGEKLGILIFAGLAGWLLYGSLSQKPEDRVPQQLQTAVSSAQQQIDGFTWTRALEEEDATKLAESFVPIASVTVEASDYAIAGLNAPVVPPTVLREDPPLLTAIELVGFGGAELMGFAADDALKKDKKIEELREQREKERERERQRERDREGQGGGFGPNADPNRRSIGASRSREGIQLNDTDRREVIGYAAIMAKVPVEEQLEAYQQSLSNALGYDARNDLPAYLAYYVERREVRGTRQGPWRPVSVRNGYDNKDLPVVSAKSLIRATADWAGDLEEPADRSYLHSVLTFPVPPLVSRNWGREVVHPDVPMQIETEIREREESERERSNTLDIDDDDNDLIGDGASDAAGGRFSRGTGGGFGDVSDFYDGGGGGFEAGGGFGGGGGGGGRRSFGGSGSDIDYKQPFIMLRFFDMTAKSGRQYQYRVRLVMRDANHGVSKRYLSKEVVARREQAERNSRRLTDWSEPSAPIAIPPAGAIRVAGVKAASDRSSTAEDTISVWVKSFDRQDGKLVEASIERSLRRGSVANFVERNAEYIDGRNLVKSEQYRFRTDLMVVDIRGGKNIGRDATTTGQVLVMDGAGGLSVRTEITDMRDVMQTIEIYAEDERGRDRGGEAYGGDFFFETGESF